MDSLIAASARALAAGDVLSALKWVALRDDPPALALRGIAMAQLGELARARALLQRAERGFGPQEVQARARCVVARAEVALAMRELGGSTRALASAAEALAARGDQANALQARLILLRRLLLLGRLDDAATALQGLDAQGLPAALAAVAALAAAELALRALQTDAARVALRRAEAAAALSRVPALQAEVAEAQAVLQRPAASRIGPGGQPQALALEQVAALLASGALVVDGCRHGLHAAGQWLPLARRPLLFALLRGLAEAWPAPAEREALIASAFRTQVPDETHRARLRVEIGRLRQLVRPMAQIVATARGFALQPPAGQQVVVLAPPLAGDQASPLAVDQASLLALLADGAAWSTSALALALGASQRTVQRALAELEAQGRVRGLGRARARRWLAPPLAGFTTILLLPAALPIA